MESNNAPAAARGYPALDAARRFSRYVHRVLEAEPELGSDSNRERPFTAEEMLAQLSSAPIPDETALQRALRRLRKRVMLRLIARDLSGCANLPEVVGTATALAEVTLSCALAHLERWFTERYGAPIGAESGEIQRLHVIGMGKLGGSELNVSSDIDLIIAYPEEGQTDGDRPVSNHEFFTRLARRVIAAIDEITADGYVFRVDMRLRPYGEGGPLVTSFDMLENYFVTQGREWERYAWIKGRPITGDRSAELLELARLFVFRRHLDYNALASMRELHRQVRTEVERRDMLDNIKLGPGGIREIEFIVQVFQLIRAGRDPELREQSTLAVLSLLRQRNVLPAHAVDELNDAYVFLRNLEHRLQYVDDRQTQSLPTDEDDRQTIAQSMGFTEYGALLKALNGHRDRVTRHFEQIFATVPEKAHVLSGLWHDSVDENSAESCAAMLRSLGYGRVHDLLQRLRTMRGSHRYREMPASSQSRLDRLVPLAIETAAAQAGPDSTLERLLQLLESISRREAYLALLEEFPQALERLSELMSASPWVAQYLTQHPILLDELLDTRTLYSAPDWTGLRTLLRSQLDNAEGDTESQMDVLRHFKHSLTIRLVAQDLAGTLPLETLSDHLSDLACLILEEVIRRTWHGMRQRHREEPAFGIVGYGKLGGKELGYASDLDLVFLYRDTAPEAAENYARLAMRINTWLTSTTSAGVLYDTDLRLRPDGAGGMLVSPLDSFAEYQARHAWAWEHQALTRARFVAGDAEIGHRFEDIRISVLRQKRDLAQLRDDVATMRQKMLAAHPNTSGLFDLKHDRGGIIDVEFIVQYLVLGHAHAYPELTGNIGNLALLKLAGRIGLIDERMALGAHEAYRRFRQLQHSLRLEGNRYARVPVPAVHEATRMVLELWEQIFGASMAITHP